MHQWRRLDSKWLSELTVKGHFGAVSDLDWDTNFLSLATTSAD